MAHWPNNWKASHAWSSKTILYHRVFTGAWVLNVGSCSLHQNDTSAAIHCKSLKANLLQRVRVGINNFRSESKSVRNSQTQILPCFQKQLFHKLQLQVGEGRNSKHCSQFTKSNQEGWSTAQKPETMTRPRTLLQAILQVWSKKFTLYKKEILWLCSK